MWRKILEREENKRKTRKERNQEIKKERKGKEKETAAKIVLSLFFFVKGFLGP